MLCCISTAADEPNCMTELLTFDSGEEFDDANRDLGWDIEYRQLNSDPFRAQFLISMIDDVVVTSESFTGTMELAAAPPDDTYALVVPSSQSYGSRFNSKIIDSNTLVLLTPGSDLHAVTQKSGGAVVVHVPSSLLEEIAPAIAPGTQLPANGSSVILNIASDILTSLRDSVRAGGTNAVADSDLTATKLAEQVVRIAIEKPIRSKKRVADHRQIIVKASEMINDQLHSELNLSKLCSHANVGSRTLERVFKREFGIPPLRYILSRRMNEVRRCLLSCAPEEMSVTDAAHSFGFNHMGRFSGEYRRFFGEYPSETLSKKPSVDRRLSR